MTNAEIEVRLQQIVNLYPKEKLVEKMLEFLKEIKDCNCSHKINPEVQTYMKEVINESGFITT